MEAKLFEDMKGRVLTKITGKVGDDEMRFVADDGSEFVLYFEPDCDGCSTCEIADIVGDLNDLIGSPILLAEEVTNQSPIEQDSFTFTWTFYKLATIKGYVTISWYGESNGYYNESVSFKFIPPNTDKTKEVKNES